MPPARKQQRKQGVGKEEGERERKVRCRSERERQYGPFIPVSPVFVNKRSSLCGLRQSVAVTALTSPLLQIP